MSADCKRRFLLIFLNNRNTKIKSMNFETSVYKQNPRSHTTFSAKIGGNKNI